MVVVEHFHGETAGNAMSEITLILEAVKKGDREAAEKLLPLTYQELRRIAGQMMGNEREGHTLQPTALIHEAYLRLADPEGEQPDWDCRAHFFTAAAEAMRWILIDHARRKLTRKRGGDQVRTTLDEAEFETEVPPDELLAIDEALKKLETENPKAAEVVKLRYFAGMTVRETAGVLGVSPRTVDRTWQGAKAWLFRELSD
jgi:RNA polymerase sigma factor (TIGR02999 family)